jgi:HlyD family secretion protein
MLKLFCVVVAVAAVIGLSFAIDAESRSKTTAVAPATGKVSGEVHAPGRVEGATDEIDLRVQFFGRVEEVLVREGQTVELGEPLVRLDAMQQEQECAIAESALAAAEAELDRLVNGARAEERREAAADLKALAARLESSRQREVRIASLRDKGASTAQEHDDLRAEVKALEAEMESARARADLVNAPARDEDLRLARSRIKSARARLEAVRDEHSRATLLAPISAQVLRINVQTGELTGPDSSEPALILADTSRLYVRAYVDEFDAPRIQLNMPARIAADGLPDNVVGGHEVRLAPRMTQKPLRTDDPLERFDTKVREVWIELDEAGTDRLVVGLPVDAVLLSKASGATEEAPAATNPSPASGSQLSPNAADVASPDVASAGAAARGASDPHADREQP